MKKHLFAIIMAVTTGNETNEFVINKGVALADCTAAIQKAGKRTEYVGGVRIVRSFFCERVK